MPLDGGTYKEYSPQRPQRGFWEDLKQSLKIGLYLLVQVVCEVTRWIGTQARRPIVGGILTVVAVFTASLLLLGLVPWEKTVYHYHKPVGLYSR